MFQGSANVPKMEHARLVQAAGGTFNGSTHQDYTNYYEALPAEGARAGAVPRGRPDGRPGDHRGEPPQPDRRGEGGDPGQRAQPALRRLPLAAAAADRLRELRQHPRRLRLLRRPRVLHRRRRHRLLLPLLRPGQRRPLHRRRPRRRRDRSGWCERWFGPVAGPAGAADPADRRAVADVGPLDGGRGRAGPRAGAGASAGGCPTRSATSTATSAPCCSPSCSARATPPGSSAGWCTTTASRSPRAATSGCSATRSTSATPRC